jgi:hypothetical protein
MVVAMFLTYAFPAISLSMSVISLIDIARLGETLHKTAQAAPAPMYSRMKRKATTALALFNSFTFGNVNGSKVRVARVT